MTPDINQTAETIYNLDKIQGAAIVVVCGIVILFVLFYFLKTWMEGYISKKEAESIAKDSLLEEKIKNIETKVNAQVELVDRHYNKFYALLNEIKDKLISKEDLNNNIKLKIAEHKENCLKKIKD